MKRSFCRLLLSGMMITFSVLSPIARAEMRAENTDSTNAVQNQSAEPEVAVKQGEASARVADAYVQGDAGGQVWKIGTRTIEMTFDAGNGRFRLVRFTNKSCKPAVEYVDEAAASAPFALDADGFGKKGRDEAGWALTNAAAKQVVTGGRPAVQVDFALAQAGLVARYHVLAFPNTSILRQWVEFENGGAQPMTLKSPGSATFQLRGDEATSYLHAWMAGGHVAADQGKMYRQPVTSSYNVKFAGSASVNLVPWLALCRDTGAKDGLFLALEYLGNWSMGVDHEAGGTLNATANLPELAAKVLAPGERLEMPLVTFGVFSGGLDNMAVSLYDWQYEYLWDYTNPAYYARPRTATHWFFCSYNLQEQFTARLAALDMDTADAMRTMGYEVLWDDAGWSSFPGFPPDGYGSVFQQTYEGPDFAETQRYVHKMGAQWLLWFAGRPSTGILDTKVGAWGDFEWRTDGVGFPDLAADRSFRQEVKQFLDAHPGSTFHTCSGGSTYSHTFEIGGRYANYNYLSDLGRGPYVNHYFSYLEPPDRWGDCLTSIASIYGRPDGSTRPMAEVMEERKGVPPSVEDLQYVKDTARSMLTNVPNPYWTPVFRGEQREAARYDMELYRFLRSEGLAGRWSYVFHPLVEGEEEYYAFQRTSRDRRKACIILTHRAEKPVVVRPQGLLPDASYLVGFDSTRSTQSRTGADLMASGIAIGEQKPGELIYLNLPNRPGSGTDKTPPQSPGRVLARRETNIGHSGVGLYWSPGTDNQWISYYEVRRDGAIVDKVAVGNYYFDHAAGWMERHEYAVRTMDGDGNASGWTAAEWIAGEPLTFSSLGGHFAQSGRDGWSAETTADGVTFQPMTWIPRAKSPAADFGGTPHQRGGVEGYWEGKDGARVGRGWQQASTTEGCVRAWTAPRAGTVRITGRAMREYYHRDQGGPLQVKILHGERPIWPASPWAAVATGGLNGAAHDLALNVAKGDVVRFVLDRGTTPEHDLLAWMPRIVYEEAVEPAAPSAVVRILCGSTSACTDRCGNVWAADQYFTGGNPILTRERIDGASPTSDDQPLYQSGRAGRDFSYTISVPTGLYSVRLKFAESKHDYAGERPFNIAINGQAVLEDFDIVQAGRGAKRAVERTFRNVVPNAAGQVVLHFAADESRPGASDNAMVQAVEILPESRQAIRVNAGGDGAFIDWKGCAWAADAYFDGGTAIQSASPVAHASPTLHDQNLYRTARTGKSFSYAFDVPPGLYTVHLKFAELWAAKAGERPMDIEVNGRVVWASWDPASAAGTANMAADIRTSDVAPDKDGRITLRIRAVGANDAILQGIEIE